MSKETYLAARARLFRELPALGYKITTYNMGRTLKVPYVEKNGRRFDFHAQSVYDHNIDLSLWIDIRNMSAAEFDKHAMHP